MPYTAERRKAKRAAGYCTMCLARKPSGGYKMCDLCRPKANRNALAYQAKRRANGECIQCANPTSGRSLCESCVDKRKVRYNAKIEAGLCSVLHCLSEPTAGQLCEEHWYQMISVTHKLGGKKAVPMLRRLWDEQRGICALSGETLVKGGNASLDHIKATARGGTNDESNLQWATLRANRMKSDMSVEEFRETCRRIADYVAPAKEEGNVVQLRARESSGT